jgi:cytidylate kinase
MSERIVLGLAGRSGTGKSTVAKYLSSKHGFRAIEGSTLIAQAAEEAGVTLGTRSDFANFYRQAQIERGADWISRRILCEDDDRLLQVGLRSRPNFLNIKEAGGIVIGLVCPTEVCFNRLPKDLPKSAKTLEEYLETIRGENSQDDLGHHTDWVVEHADYRLDTSVPLLDTYTAVDRVIEEQISQ